MCRALCKASSTAASVLLSFFQTVISTTTFPTGYTDENGTEEPSGGGGHIAAIAAVVAVIVVLLVCVAIYFCLRRRGCTLPYHRAESHGYVGLSKGSQERSVTFLELWYFVSSREDEDFLKPLRSLVSGLRTNGVSRGEELLRSDMSQQDIMSELFVWKEDYRGKNQMKDLLESCAKYDLTDEVGVMQEYRKKPFPISPNMIKRIIWAIDNRDKIKAVFSTLKIPLQPLKRVEDAFADVENLRNVGHQTKRRGDNKLFMATAIEEVIKWSHQPFEMNPRVLLAMALESNDCTPIDRTFFIDEGPISYVELWEIAQHGQGEAYWSQVADLAYHLTADETSKQPPLGRISVDVAYEQLCGWKSSCNNDHQKDLLLAALERNGLTAACSHVKEFRMNVTAIIDRKMAKCLISAMEKEESIRRVLEELEFSDYFQNNSGEEDIWTAATNRLEAWGNEEVTMNRFVSLSLALERADCTTIDQEFLAGGPLSYLELWEFVRVDDRPDHVARIISIVDSLTDDHSTHTASAEGSSVDYAYSKLCEWKKTSSKPYQRGMLLVALKMNGLAEAAEQLRDYRKPLETTIDDNIINCIVWTLKNDARLRSFLDQLGVSLTETVEGKDISLAAVERLRSWTEQSFTVNPLVLFSLALENAGCSPNECNFLKGGPISFIELWELANADFGESYFGQLVAVVQMLNGDANEVTSKPDSPQARQELYQQLCNWKEACSKNYQRDVLTAALIKEGLETALSHIEAYRSNQNNVLSDLELEHILWYTDDIPNLFANLKSIEQDRQGGENAGKEGVVQKGTLNLHRWLHRKYTPNEISRVVQLDLALEESGSSPIDRNFFQVEKAAKSPVDADTLAAQLTEVHISKLMAALSSGAAKESKSAEVICNENDESLFNVSKMIRDWLANQGCSHYEKRKRLWLAARQIGRGDIADAILPSGEQIMSPSAKVSPSTDDRSSGDFSGCSSLPLGEAQMYHAQLVDVAMKLLMNDVHPLAKALGMHEGQLADYRMPPDVEKGSVRLTMTLFQSLKSRNMLSIALQNAGYSDIAKSLNLDCEPSLSELGSAVMELKDDELSSLGKLLHLREDDVTACRDDTGTIDKLRLMRLWKNAVRPTPYNYRTALVRALQIVGVEASDTETSGKGQSSTGGGAAGEFTPEEMEYQRHVVLKLLPAEDTKGEGSDQMAKASLAWIKRWLPGLKPGKDFDIAGRIEVNNSLVGGNYSEVAREMMLLENQIMLLKTSNSLLQKFKRRVAKK